VDNATLLVGSLEALREVLDDSEVLSLASSSDVIVIPTAAAFTGALEAALAIAHVLEGRENVETLMATDRAGCGEPYFARRVREADLVILSDGSSLHARTTWRDTLLGEALGDARHLVAIGAVGGVLGDVMIDPRGGAPTTGLSYRSGLVVTVPASPDQLDRTRSLLGEKYVLAVLGPSGVIAGNGDTWRVVRGEVVLTRALAPTSL
jgi:hypothetical protein